MDISKELRKQIFLTAYSGGVGHLASAFSAVEILQMLYIDRVMKFNAENPDWDERDYFILSKGHGSLVLYATLAQVGFFPKAELYKFCQPDGILGGEPNTLEVPGVEASTGSLGHGLGIGIGIALALKSYCRSNFVYVLVGDGECQEGSIWEAVMSGAAFGLDNLTVIIDHNRIQKMDFVEKTMGAARHVRFGGGQIALGEQFRSFGWQVKSCDGHDTTALRETLTGEWQPDKPRCVIAETVKGKGLSLMENNPAWHWRMPSKKELKTFCAELNITQEELDECKRRI
ncbi:MAG: transketolase [Clostridiales bacterium]|jgi:transketolase|nr:transketolase [Clostridiales bacterium]